MMVLVTGASGFVGCALCRAIIGRRSLRISVRNKASNKWPDEIDVVEASLSPRQDWISALTGVSVVIHCAARVHVMNEKSSDPLAEFRRVNVEGTLHLARQAAASGVKRFVFLSSIKVNGEQTQDNSPFTADQRPNPGDPYGISKMEAEDALRSLAKLTGMEVVIIRPPLVYGPGVKANFLSMLRWLKRGIPLPLGAVTDNKRSLVGLDNLVDLIVTCIDHPRAANQTFLVSDGESLSTTALLKRMGVALGRPARLISVPVPMLVLGASLLGKSGVMQRLCGSLEVDISKTQEFLDWGPPISIDEELRRTVSERDEAPPGVVQL